MKEHITVQWGFTCNTFYHTHETLPWRGLSSFTYIIWKHKKHLVNVGQWIKEFELQLAVQAGITFGKINFYFNMTLVRLIIVLYICCKGVLYLCDFSMYASLFGVWAVKRVLQLYRMLCSRGCTSAAASLLSAAALAATPPPHCVLFCPSSET